MGNRESINELEADLFHPEEVDRFSDPKAARKKAMDFLARREYGRAELVKKLAKGGFDRDIAEAAVTVLSDDGLQDDRRFAQSFLQSRIGQGKGPVRIEMELAERGLRPGTIADVIAECEQDWFELARDVRNRKFGKTTPADFAAKAKQMRFLQYRGFEQAQIQAAMSTHSED